jgi:tripartite ATP-independent transporter DctP family solute receptor
VKRILAVAFIAIIGAAVYIACSKENSNIEREATGKPVSLLTASLAVPSHPYGMAMEWANEWLMTHNSTVSLDMQRGGVLGNDRETVEGTMTGSIDIGVTSDSIIATLIPKVAFTSFPGLFSNYDDVKNTYWNGWVGEEVIKEMRNNGLELLCFLDNGFRWMTNSRHPITTLADVKGMKMRVADMKIYIDFFDALGCVSAPIPFSDLATALQQKVVDGQDNGLSSIWPYSFYQFQKYLTPTNHMYSSGIYFMNSEKWNSLTPQQQKDVKDAFKYAADKQIAYNLNSYADIEETIKQAGCEIAIPDPSMAQEFLAVGKKMAASEYWQKTLGDDLIKRMYP